MRTAAPCSAATFLRTACPLVSVNATFALLQVYGVRRKVPMDDRVAVSVEVKSFLADGRGREYKRPEWGVEGLTHLPLACSRLAVLTLLGAEAHGEVVA